MTRGYGTESIAEREAPLQIRRLEARGAAPPVVRWKAGEALRAETVCQKSRLHRAVADDTRAALQTPGNLARRDLATNQREWRLQRIHVTDLVAPLEQLHREVGNAAPSHLTLIDEAGDLAPRVIDRSSRFIGPVELVEVDALHAESPERCLTLASDRLGREYPSCRSREIALIPHDPALGEDVRSISLGPLAKESPDDFFRVTKPVRGRGVYPVEPQLRCMTQRTERCLVILRPPVHEATRTADGPGSRADAADSWPLAAERACG